MSCRVHEGAVSIIKGRKANTRPLPAPLPQKTYRSLSRQDLQRIRLAGELTGKV